MKMKMWRTGTETNELSVKKLYLQMVPCRIWCNGINIKGNVLIIFNKYCICIVHVVLICCFNLARIYLSPIPKCCGDGLLKLFTSLLTRLLFTILSANCIKTCRK